MLSALLDLCVGIHQSQANFSHKEAVTLSFGVLFDTSRKGHWANNQLPMMWDAMTLTWRQCNSNLPVLTNVDRIRMWSVSSCPRLTFINHLLSTETVLILTCTTCENRSSITTHVSIALMDQRYTTRLTPRKRICGHTCQMETWFAILNRYFCSIRKYIVAWWRHQMETFSELLVFCAGNSPAIGGFHSQRPVTRSFDVFCNLCLNKPLNKQSWGWWFETPSRPLWRHCNGYWRKLLYACFDLPRL